MMNPLPPGQYASDIFPRFGLSQYANRFPPEPNTLKVTMSCDDISDLDISAELASLERAAQTSDFHCVTTWSKRDQAWEGVKFKDFFNELVKTKFPNSADFKFVVFMAQDGYKTSLLLEDLLKDNVMLADHLNGAPLTIEHGAPIRLIAPAHYGYKNLKHLDRIEFYNEKKKIKQGFLSFMDHPRARVAKEERAIGGPGWVFRYLYRPLIKSTVKQFDKAMKKYYTT